MTKEKHGHGVGGGEVTTGLVECVEVLHGVWPCAVFEYRHSSGFMPTNKWLVTTGFLSHQETMSAILAHTNKAACKNIYRPLFKPQAYCMRLSISLWPCLLAAALSNHASDAWILAFKPNWPLE